MRLVKVKFKLKENSTLCSQKNLLLLLNNHEVRVTGVFVKQTEIIVSCASFDDAEKIFNDECRQLLANSDFEPLLPLELKAHRSVIINNVNNEIIRNDVEIIRQEIERCNPWSKVLEIFKFRNGRGMKITFSASAMASKCCDIGLSLFFLHIPNYQVKKDVFYNLLTCYTCYQVEDHTSAMCPKKLVNPNFKICSNCSEETHDYKICNIRPANYKCINCSGTHSSMSMTCPYRQDLLKAKRLSSNTSFATKLKLSPNINSAKIDQNIMAKTLTITITAALKEQQSPGSFSTYLNTLLQLNDLPAINMGDISPPAIALDSVMRSNDLDSVSQGELTATVPDLDSARSNDRIMRYPMDVAAVSAHSNRDHTAQTQTKPSAQVPAARTTGAPTPASLTITPTQWSPNVSTFKSHGTKLETQQDLFAAINSGKLLFIDEINNTYIDVINMKKDTLSQLRPDNIPKPTVLKKDAFDCLVKSTLRKK